MHRNSYRIQSTGYTETVYRIGGEEFKKDIMGVGHCN